MSAQMATAFGAIRGLPLYKRFMRPLIWGPIWAFRNRREKRVQRVFERLAEQDRATLMRERQQYESLYGDHDEPLVSVTTATYNRGRLLAEQTLPSVLKQTYKRLEIIIIGDHCTDDTVERMSKVTDPRVRFLNLPERSARPRNKVQRYLTHGLEAWTLARRSATGLWLAHLDDDDVFTPDHIEKLLQHARGGNHEMVYGRSRKELRPGQWTTQGHATFDNGRVTGGFISHSTVLRRRYLTFFNAIGCLDVGMAGDAYMWRRMFNAGVRVGFLNEVVTHLPLRPGERERAMLQGLNDH